MGGSSQNIKIVNDCLFMILPLYFDKQNLTVTDFELPKDTSHSVKAQISSSYLVARTNFQSVGTFNNGSNVLTVVVFKFRANSSPDEYYAHKIHGFNLATSKEAIVGSSSHTYGSAKAGCNGDVNNWCPEELRVRGRRGCHSCQGGLQWRCEQLVSRGTQSEGKKRVSQRADYTVRFCSSVGTFSTIRPGSQLRSTDRLISPNGDFVAGFYGERNRFLGIWCNNDESMKVWIADIFGLNIPTSSDHNLVVNTYTRDLIITAGGKTVYNITDLQMGPQPNVTPAFTKDGYILSINTNKTVLWKTSFITIILLGKQEIRMKNCILKETNIRWFTRDSISAATDSFSDQNNTGEGGFGLVYRGSLDGNEIVVKMLCPKSSQGIKEFEHEIKAIVNAKHTNVVSVKGYCIHGKELMLVYEYMHNMGLVYHLHGKKRY
ncbi:unnamed protein product [Lactuca virosa]|uniref:Protein kinase domain-containing protein n=1 Tax=Lactuca virosa TaxID=75947 RepID=A0AAU9MHY0_9ASTR|nr:unnamed protein product [Lactuca virosa]